MTKEIDLRDAWLSKAYAVTKYLPELYNEQGIYTSNEWTSFSDIGNEVNRHGEILTLQEYLQVETAYIEAVKIFMRSLGKESIVLFDVLKHSAKKLFKPHHIDLYTLYKQIENKGCYSIEEVDSIVKLALRELAQLSILIDKDTNSCVHFGFDYYMYFVSDGIDVTEMAEEIEGLGIFMMVRRKIFSIKS